VVRHGQVVPGISAHPGRVTGVVAVEELLQEPVDSLDPIAIAPLSPPERRIRDQRPGRPPSVELRSDPTKQLVNLGRVVTTAVEEPNVSDLVCVHQRSPVIALMSRSVTPAAPSGSRADFMASGWSEDHSVYLADHVEPGPWAVPCG